MSEKDSGAKRSCRLRTWRKTNISGGFVSPPRNVRQRVRDRSGILFDDARRRKDIADSPLGRPNYYYKRAQAPLFYAHATHGYFIPFAKRRLLLYRYTSIDK